MRYLAPLLATLLATACASHGPTAARPAKPVNLFVGYSGARWPQDFDVLAGRCDHTAIGGAVLGTGTGVLLTRSDVPRDNRASATLIGARVGDLVGRKVGEHIDDADRACLGHSLEIGRAGKKVAWDNALTGVHYEIVPDEGHSDIAGLCRSFKLKARSVLGKSNRHGTACERSPGLWQLSTL